MHERPTRSKSNNEVRGHPKKYITTEGFDPEQRAERETRHQVAWVLAVAPDGPGLGAREKFEMHWAH